MECFVTSKKQGRRKFCYSSCKTSKRLIWKLKQGKGSGDYNINWTLCCEDLFWESLQNAPGLTITRFVVYSYSSWSAVRIDNPAQCAQRKGKAVGRGTTARVTQTPGNATDKAPPISSEPAAPPTPPQACSRACAKHHPCSPTQSQR